MLWFWLALLGYLALAVVFVLDKFILTKSLGKPVVYTFYSTIFLFGALLAWPFGVELLKGFDWWWAIVSGVSFGLAMWAMFVALKHGETSHISPFVGAVVTIATYVLSSVFFQETLTGMQIAGIVVLTIASMLLSMEKSRTGGASRWFLWAIIAGALYAVSHVSAKYIYEVYDFLTGFVWTRSTTGLVGLFVLLYPSVRRSVGRAFSQEKQPKKKTFGKQHAGAIVFWNKLLGIVGVILIQYAISIGSVTLVNAMAGVQYVLMFMIIYLFTKVAPKVFQEYFTKREITVQLIALLLVFVGSAFFVFGI